MTRQLPSLNWMPSTPCGLYYKEEAMIHKFVKAEYDAIELKKKNGKDGLKNRQMSSINNVPGLRAAVILLLDAEGIEYQS